MNIGQAAQASGLSAKMIRYYEQIGLIPPAARTASAYREYTAADVQRLRFVRRARDLGFPVAEIGRLLSLWRDDARHSAQVKRIACDHIAALERRIRDLEDMAAELRTLAASCHGDERPECPILAGLEQAEGDGGQPACTAPVRAAPR